MERTGATGGRLSRWGRRQRTSVTGRRGALFLLSLTLTVLSLVDFILDSILEGVCFLLGREVQSDLTVICREGMKVRLWRAVNNLVVELLLPNLPPCLQIKHPYEVGALRVVFDEADDPGVLQAPHRRAVRQSHVQLGDCGGHGSTPSAQQVLQLLILLQAQQGAPGALHFRLRSTAHRLQVKISHFISKLYVCSI